MVDITVLMAVHNPPLAWLEQAVYSILAQSYPHFELLIVDDGSADPVRLHHLGPRAARDSRVHIAREPHRGLTATLNRGLAITHTSLVARHDADDWSAPDRLARQRSAFEAQPGLALCGSNAWTHQEDGAPLWPTRLPLGHSEIHRAFPRGNPFVHGATMFRKEAIDAVGGYRECFPCSQDYDLFWRVAERYPVLNLERPLYHYRYSSKSVSSLRAREQWTAHQAIRQLAQSREHGLVENPEVELAHAGAHTRSADLLRVRLKQADHLMLAGRYGPAMAAYLGSVAEHPFNSLAWAKLARLLVFRSAPLLRQACFA